MLGFQTRHLAHWAHGNPLRALAGKGFYNLIIKALRREGHPDHIEIVTDGKSVKFEHSDLLKVGFAHTNIHMRSPT